MPIFVCVYFSIVYFQIVFVILEVIPIYKEKNGFWWGELKEKI